MRSRMGMSAMGMRIMRMIGMRGMMEMNIGIRKEG